MQGVGVYSLQYSNIANRESDEEEIKEKHREIRKAALLGAGC